ncbi:MAG: hypothetical protein JTJ11_06115 [Collinsella sp.]|nr:hypothetical protein [Collinsella sp.]
MEMEKFINTGIAEGWVRKTGNSERKFINGQNQDCPIYEVRVDKLHFNVQNGRIATFISRYQAEHPEGLPQDQAELDNLIAGMVEADNPKHLKTTMLDIKNKGQQQSAIILTNGVVIDGNRRFTCLRKLSAAENTLRMLRCCVFPDTYDENAIKGLELEIQLGEDTKQEYDAISRLVDIDRWVNEGRMTAEEYAKHANMKQSEMKNSLAQIDMLKDFLEFCEAPGAFHIAQDLKLQGPIESLTTRLGKVKNKDDREEIKNAVFVNLMCQTFGDATRGVREFIDNLIADDKLREEQLDYAVEVLERLAEKPDDVVVTTEYLRDTYGSDTRLKEGMKASRNVARAKAGNRKIKNGQVRAVRNALSDVNDVDVEILHKLEPEQLADMQDGLQSLLEKAQEVLDVVQKTLEG